MGTANAATQKNCSMRYILDRFDVITVKNPSLESTEIGFSAILASVLGCYYRVLAAMSADLAWTEPPTIGLACVLVSLPQLSQ